MDRHRLDAIVAPTMGPAWPTDHVLGDRLDGGSSAGPAAIAGYPDISVPMGLVSGLPVGISFFGRAWSEPTLLDDRLRLRAGDQAAPGPQVPADARVTPAPCRLRATEEPVMIRVHLRRIRPTRVALVLTLSLLVGACSATPSGEAAAAAAGGTEILWDRYGVPHIFAPDHPSLFRAYGYAQMEAHAELLVRLYAQARGRGAEFYGPEYLDSDRWIRTNGLPDTAKAVGQGPERRVRRRSSRRSPAG